MPTTCVYTAVRVVDRSSYGTRSPMQDYTRIIGFILKVPEKKAPATSDLLKFVLERADLPVPTAYVQCGHLGGQREEKHGHRGQ